MTPLRWLLSLLGLLVIGAAASVAVVATVAQPDALATIPDAEPVTAPVEIERTDKAVQTTAGLAALNSFEATTALAGIVTEIALKPGDTVKAGDRLVTIDDKPLLAFVADAPLVRELGLGDEGPDVARLQRFLGEAVEADIGDDGRFGSSTASAVSAFRRDNGLGRSSSIGPDQLMWIGSGPLPVVEVAVGVGDRVESGGVIATGPAQEIVVDVRADLRGFDQEPLVLTVDGVAVPFDADSGISPEAATVLHDELGVFEELPAVVALAEPIEYPAVPASAVLTGTDGGTCVVDLSNTVTPVTVVSTSFGRSLLFPSAALPAAVVVNPSSLRERC